SRSRPYPRSTTLSTANYWSSGRRKRRTTRGAIPLPGPDGALRRPPCRIQRSASYTQPFAQKWTSSRSSSPCAAGSRDTCDGGSGFERGSTNAIIEPKWCLLCALTKACPLGWTGRPRSAFDSIDPASRAQVDEFPQFVTVGRGLAGQLAPAARDSTGGQRTRSSWRTMPGGLVHPCICRRPWSRPRSMRGWQMNRLSLRDRAAGRAQVLTQRPAVKMPPSHVSKSKRILGNAVNEECRNDAPLVLARSPPHQASGKLLVLIGNELE